MFLWEQPFISCLPTWGETCRETAWAGNKSRNCFERGHQKKVNTLWKLRLYLRCSHKTKASSHCFWEQLLWIWGEERRHAEQGGFWVMEFWATVVTAPHRYLTTRNWHNLPLLGLFFHNVFFFFSPARIFRWYWVSYNLLKVLESGCKSSETKSQRRLWNPLFLWSQTHKFPFGHPSLKTPIRRGKMIMFSSPASLW